MRKSFDGLMAIIRDVYELDPYANALYLFCGRDSRKLKALHFDKDGFVLLQKRLDGSEKAVNYAQNHRETLMNYLTDGRCEISNNAAERRAKSYVMGRKNFLFHDTVDGANASAVVLSLIETAKANNLNIYQYLYTLLLYMSDYKEEPAGIKQLLPWSGFIKERCSTVTDIEKERPETRGNLPV